MAAKGTPGWRQNVSEGTRRGLAGHRRLQRSGIGRAIDAWRRGGAVQPQLLPYLAIAEGELLELRNQYGEDASPALGRLVDVAVSLLIGFRAELARFVTTGDTGALDRMATLSNSIRSTLVAAGLDTAKAEPMDLRTYLAARSDRAGSTIAPAPDATPARDADPAAGANDAKETPR